MTAAISIIGSPISPYVRKVLAILDIKGAPFRCTPIVPMLGGDDFTRISPLRRVPVLVEGDFSLPDSSAIAQYLEERFPAPSIFPEDVKARARARWFEEYADDHLGRNVIFHLFFQQVVRPRVLKEEPDMALVEEALTVGLPKALDYLEGELGTEGFLCGSFSIADIAVASMLKNAFYTGWQIDGDRWPKMKAYLARAYAEPCLARTGTLADTMMQARRDEHQALVDAFCDAGTRAA